MSPCGRYYAYKVTFMALELHACDASIAGAITEERC
jgi:hypothetical protein